MIERLQSGGGHYHPNNWDWASAAAAQKAKQGIDRRSRCDANDARDGCGCRNYLPAINAFRSGDALAHRGIDERCSEKRQTHDSC
jgi:hypothetical protein